MSALVGSGPSPSYQLNGCYRVRSNHSISILSDGVYLIKYRLSQLSHAQYDFTKRTSFGDGLERLFVVVERIRLSDARLQLAGRN